MRPLALAFALVLALPVVAANEPPVAIPQASTTDAVLFQPVTFTSASVDPDGTLVSQAWTDDNGRDHAGASWTHAFTWPGLHTIRLTVTDDAGASAFADVTVLVRAPLMHGRAVALAQGNATLADTGEVATEQDGSTDASVAEAHDGDLRVAGLDSTFVAVQQRAIATSRIGAVDVPTLFGTIHVSGVLASVLATCDAGTTVAVHDSEVRFNDAPLVPPGEVPANTRVDAGGVTLVLNAQETTPDGATRVAAVRVLRPGEPPVELAVAEAGVSHCPWSG